MSNILKCPDCNGEGTDKYGIACKTCEGFVRLNTDIKDSDKKLFRHMLPFLLDRVRREVIWELACTPESKMRWAKHIFNTEILPFL